jgi:GNAT superfamily N-acetyltransferase
VILAAKDLAIEVRPGTVEDIPLMLSFIRSMAEFEKLQVTATEQSLRESLFSEDPAGHTLLVFVDGAPAAYAVYCFIFASMVGTRVLWLDDLYVEPNFRRQGIASTLMAYLANVAIQNDCGRFEWMVLDWNAPAIDFYSGFGATILDEWRICRLDEQGLASLAEQLVRADSGG